MSGTISVSDLCKKYDLKPARFYYWKEKLLKNSSHVFEDRGTKNNSHQRIIEEQRVEIAKLYWIRSDSDRMSMEKHLYRGRVKGGGVINLSPVHEVKVW